MLPVSLRLTPASHVVQSATGLVTSVVDTRNGHSWWESGCVLSCQSIPSNWGH
jgi:hypothetical protein